MMLKTKTLRDPKYLHWIKFQPCIITGYRYVEGASMGVDPAHIRWGFDGMGMKPPDNHVLPLRHDLHEIQHRIGEVEFWRQYTPFRVQLTADSPEERFMCALIAHAEQLYEGWRK